MPSHNYVTLGDDQKDRLKHDQNRA